MNRTYGLVDGKVLMLHLVLYYRHKLQRGFLSRDTVPKAEEMKSMSDFLGELETYLDLEGSIIRATKIHKVLKQMIKLENIPLEEDFKFKDRSAKLLVRWNETLSNEWPTDEKAEEKGEGKVEDKPIETKSESAPEAAPAINGDLRKYEETSSKEEGQDEKKPDAKVEDKTEAANPVEEGTEKTANGAVDAPQVSKDSSSKGTDTAV